MQTSDSSGTAVKSTANTTSKLMSINSDRVKSVEDSRSGLDPVVTSVSNTTSMEATSFDDRDKWLEVSRLGLDPATNRYAAPIVYHEQYSFDGWPKSHTFPMDKFYATAQALMDRNKHPRPLVRSQSDFFRPHDLESIPDEWFYNAQICPDFYRRFRDAKLLPEEERYIGFREQCRTSELIRRTVLEVAGTVLTCQLACRWGIASHVAGGTHHAHPTGGAGFTILNDIAVAAQYLFDNTPLALDVEGQSETTAIASSDRRIMDIEKFLVIDLDVHQGDGTAKFNTLWNDDPDRAGRLFTLSMHCASNYPHPKATSTYDIGLPDKCDDEEYLQTLQECVDLALEEVQPDFVLYDAGVDVFKDDKLGRLSLTMDGIRRRDRWVLERCVGLNIPIAAVVGGGYDTDVNNLAQRHAILHDECAYVWRKNQMWKR